MPRLSQRDLDALRIGIKEQARQEIDQENWERTLDRAKKEPSIFPPQGVELVQACQLEVGDVLAASTFGYDFREVGVIVEISDVSPSGGPIAGDLMVTAGNGSRALKNSDTVLRKYRYQRPDGSS
jgi:hypothetical protein